MNKKLIILGIMLMLAISVTACTSTSTGKVTAETENGNFEINLDEVTSTVNFYEYNHEGTNIRFFAVKGSDSVVRTAFDACDVCGGSKGYTQRGDDIVCNTCGRSFKIDGLGTENKGYGCWPSYLSHEIESDKIIIKTEELIDQKYKFE